jgi:type II secretory pathway component GspD/PulD (secretin)
MKKLNRLTVFILTITFSLVPIALRAQDRASMAGHSGAAMVNTDVSASGALFSEVISPDQTISMDLQDANLRDVLKIFSMQSGLNFIASEAVENKKVTLYLDKVPVKLAMDKIFDTNKLTYEFDEDAGIFVVRGKEEDVDMITEIFLLKYRSVLSSNMEKQRTGLFSGESLVGGTGTTGTATASAAISDIKVTIQQMLSKNGKVSEDNKTNGLIVTDVPSRFPAIRSIIAALDMPQAQVMLDVEMLDVSKDLIDKMGFNFPNGGSLMQLTMDWASKATAFPFTTQEFKDNGVPMTRTAGNIDFGAGLPFAVTFDLLKKDVSTKLLARPRILTLNYETAEIGITKDEIISKTITTTEDSAGRPSDAEEYTRASSLTLTPEGIGVYLRVTPMINEETGEITLVVNPKSSSTTQSAGINLYNRDPEVRASKSIIKVRDGETVVLGGLIKMEKESTKSKIPVFGDIPVLGMLFRGRDTSKNVERELLVFITPHIVKDESAPLSARKPVRAPTGQNKQRSQANKVTLFTRHEAVNTALNNLDDR